MSGSTEKIKLGTVRAYLAGELTVASAAMKHGVGKTAVKRWIALYRAHGVEGLRRRRNRTYGTTFKFDAVMLMRREGLSRRETALRLGIRDIAVVGVWERLYDEGGWQALQPRPKGRPRFMHKPPLKPPSPSPVPDEQRDRDDLINELRWLRMENDYLKKLDASVQAKKAAQGKKRS